LVAKLQEIKQGRRIINLKNLSPTSRDLFFCLLFSPALPPLLFLISFLSFFEIIFFLYWCRGYEFAKWLYLYFCQLHLSFFYVGFSVFHILVSNFDLLVASCYDINVQYSFSLFLCSSKFLFVDTVNILFVGLAVGICICLVRNCQYIIFSECAWIYLAGTMIINILAANRPFTAVQFAALEYGFITVQQWCTLCYKYMILGCV
jgi:hypothetical protein